MYDVFPLIIQTFQTSNSEVLEELPGNPETVYYSWETACPSTDSVRTGTLVLHLSTFEIQKRSALCKVEVLTLGSNCLRDVYVCRSVGLPLFKNSPNTAVCMFMIIVQKSCTAHPICRISYSLFYFGSKVLRSRAKTIIIKKKKTHHRHYIVWLLFILRDYWPTAPASQCHGRLML